MSLGHQESVKVLSKINEAEVDGMLELGDCGITVAFDAVLDEISLWLNQINVLPLT